MLRIGISGSYDSSILSFLGHSLLKFTFYKELFYEIAYYRISKQNTKASMLCQGVILY